MPCPAFRSAVAVVSAPIHPGERQSPDWRTTPRIRITSSWLFAVDLVAAAFSYFVRPQRTKYRRADFDLRRAVAAKGPPIVLSAHRTRFPRLRPRPAVIKHQPKQNRERAPARQLPFKYPLVLSFRRRNQRQHNPAQHHG